MDELADREKKDAEINKGLLNTEISKNMNSYFFNAIFIGFFSAENRFSIGARE